MPNPYPAEFQTATRDNRGLIVRIGGDLVFTDQTNQPGGAIEVTDGSTTVPGVTELDFTSGATVTDGGGGIAQVAVGTTPGNALWHPAISFAYTTASLNNGVSTGLTITTGDVVAFLVSVDTGFNGTTPTFDLGVGVAGGGAGLLGGFGVDTPNSIVAGFELANFNGPYIATSTGTLQFWVSQDGLKGGAAIGGTAGTARLFVQTSSPG